MFLPMATAASILTSGRQHVDLPNPYIVTPQGYLETQKLQSQVVVSEKTTGHPGEIQTKRIGKK